LCILYQRWSEDVANHLRLAPCCGFGRARHSRAARSHRGSCSDRRRARARGQAAAPCLCSGAAQPQVRLGRPLPLDRPHRLLRLGAPPSSGCRRLSRWRPWPAGCGPCLAWPWVAMGPRRSRVGCASLRCGSPVCLAGGVGSAGGVGRSASDPLLCLFGRKRGRVCTGSPPHGACVGRPATRGAAPARVATGRWAISVAACP
jgi:hypothetical protein